jgi:pSer/pThr/pTyr-binding forkhead associated (FHA) protein
VLSIQELRALASRLPLIAFEQQMGPFALIQRPPLALQAQSLEQASRRTTVKKRSDSDSALSLILDFENLVVVTLPPVRPIDEFIVGRLPDCDIVVDDPSVSKRHAQLTWDAQERRCSVKDLGSRNGTYVDEIELGRRDGQLRDGDVLSFGDADFWFLLTSTLHEKIVKRASSVRAG